MLAQQQPHAEIINEAPGAEPNTIFKATFVSEASLLVQRDGGCIG